MGRTGLDGTGPLLFAAAVNGRIAYVAGQYVVTDPVFAAHPVTGVTWYGALKFCNWLTLASGLDASELAYAEAPAADLNGWRPVTISSAAWAVRDLTATERDALLLKLGYRLPMDGGADGPNAYDEWLKAAAARREPSGALAFGALYGFGRNDPPTPADANYLGSGDPFEPGTTPVGFYDGVNLLLDGKATTDTGNAYGLYDLSGNVWEWLQDQSPSDPLKRRNRGGSWLSSSASLKLIPGSQRNASSAVSSTGFRIVQRVLDAILVTPQADFVAAGPWGGPYVPALSDPILFRLTNVANQPIDFTAASDAPWAAVEPNAGSIAVGEATAARVTIAPHCADTLPPGENAATLRITFEPGQRTIERLIRLTVAEPLTLTPADGLVAEMFFGGAPTPPAAVYTLESASDQPVEWSVGWTETSNPSTGIPWLTINGGPSAAGEVPPHAASEVAVAIDPVAAAALPVGVHQADVTFVDDCTGEEFVRTVTLEVTGLRLEPVADGEFRGPLGGPFEPQSLIYALRNADWEEMYWTATIEFDALSTLNWLKVTPNKGTLLDPQGAAEVTVSLAPEAAALPTGTYLATVTFNANGATATRRITLSVSGEVFTVTPPADFETAGRTPATSAPAYAVYRLANIAGQGSGAIDWHASSDQPWVTINRGAAASGSLHGGEFVNILVTIDPVAAPQLPLDVFEQRFDAVVTFDNLTNAEGATRHVSLTLVAPKFNLDEVRVPSTIRQPAGPDYPFHMGRFHITTAQFVAFLNDALANPGHPRGQYMFFHAPTGDVFINAVATGESGVDLSDRTAKMFSPAASGRIRFFNGQYEVVTAPVDYSFHPVTGVSWYGAVKFCNWLTLDQGFLPRERCYSEDADPRAWRPSSISAAHWLTRDLNDGERQDLVEKYRGYRLPMDDGYNNPTPTIDSADAYNEWYKAAAWNDALRQNTLFGFGRGTLTGADANFRCSGDGFEDVANCLSGGTTPVGYYDGSVKAGSFATGPNANTFGLFDMTGNVHQWLQGRYAPPNTIDRRTLRGGSWNDPVNAPSLRASSRTLFAAPATTSNQIGFRVVRTPAPPTADFDADGTVDLLDFAPLPDCAVGPGGSPLPLCMGFDFDGDADVDLRDLSSFTNLFMTSSP